MKYENANKDTLKNEFITKLKLTEEEFARADLQKRVLEKKLESSFKETRTLAATQLVEVLTRIDELEITAGELKQMISEL